MMWEDPIVKEVRKVREEYAARFDYDLHAIYRDLKQQEKNSGRLFVSYAARRVVHDKKAGTEQSHPLASLMEVIGVLIEKYEDEHVPELTEI
jgi:hypothetical protein